MGSRRRKSFDKKKTIDCIAYDSENLNNVALVRYVKEYYYKEYILLIKSLFFMLISSGNRDFNSREHNALSSFG